MATYRIPLTPQEDATARLREAQRGYRNDCISGIYARGTPQPETDLMKETRQVVATYLNVELRSVSKGWRKMALRANRNLGGGMNRVYRFLDELRIKAGLPAAVYDHAQEQKKKRRKTSGRSPRPSDTGLAPLGRTLPKR